MRTFSSSKTRNSKVITPAILLGVMIVISAWIMRDKWATSPLYASVFVLFAELFSVFYFWRTGTWRLADSVVEAPDGLRVRRGAKELLVTYREVATVKHRSEAGVSRCILELHTPGEFGPRIEFIPLTDDESAAQLGIDLWGYLEAAVANAQSRRAA